jgi:hypothetical protein
MSTITTFNGLLSLKPTSQKPRAGEQRYLSWENRISKNGKEWIKVKNRPVDMGGKLCEIINADQTDFVDAHGNIFFNIEFSPVSDESCTSDSSPGMTTSAPHNTANPIASSFGRAIETPKITQGPNGVNETRHHLMQVANLYSLCVKAVDAAIAPNVPAALQTSEWLQAAVASLFIESSGRRTTDGVHWWSYVDKMPDKPIK